jgi:glutamyl-tRNA reductase
VRAIIADELERYRVERSAREVAPLVTALRRRVEELRLAELDRVRGAHADDPALRETFDAVTRALVNKQLHEPTVRLKDAAGTARGDLYADALTELFALQPPSDDG